jgi:4'-phosphopantetheinyl transferase EntD
MGALADLLPPAAVAVETREELDTELSATAQQQIARAVPKRQLEFISGRACARLALERLGAASTDVPSGPKREPLWPDDVVGSITHCDGYRACAVAWKSAVRSIGIDAEEHEPLRDRVLDRVSSARERGALPSGAWCFDRILFSAKEALYKAWFPLTGEWLGFGDVHLELDARAGTFAAELLVEGPMIDGRRLTQFDGRFTVEAGTVITAVAVTPTGSGLS